MYIWQRCERWQRPSSSRSQLNVSLDTVKKFINKMSKFIWSNFSFRRCELCDKTETVCFCFKLCVFSVLSLSLQPARLHHSPFIPLRTDCLKLSIAAVSSGEQTSLTLPPIYIHSNVIVNAHTPIVVVCYASIAFIRFICWWRRSRCMTIAFMFSFIYG